MVRHTTTTAPLPALEAAEFLARRPDSGAASYVAVRFLELSPAEDDVLRARACLERIALIRRKLKTLAN